MLALDEMTTLKGGYPAARKARTYTTLVSIPPPDVQGELAVEFSPEAFEGGLAFHSGPMIGVQCVTHRGGLFKLPLSQGKIHLPLMNAATSKALGVSGRDESPRM